MATALYTREQRKAMRISSIESAKTGWMGGVISYLEQSGVFPMSNTPMMPVYVRRLRAEGHDVDYISGAGESGITGYIFYRKDTDKIMASIERQLKKHRERSDIIENRLCLALMRMGKKVKNLPKKYATAKTSK